MNEDTNHDRPTEQWFPSVYQELRQLAAAWMAREKPGQTLDATALVNEAWCNLASGGSDRLEDRRYFFAAAAQSMRRILIDNARKKQREKHGGDRNRAALSDDLSAANSRPDELVALDEVLTKLEEEDPIAAELFNLKFFAGFSIEQAGEILKMPRATAYRNWNFARSWLRSRLSEE